MRICFVCLGNICRSPTAEGVFKHIVQARYPSAGITVESAGTAGYHVGARADSRSRDVARTRGYDLDSRAAQFRTEDFQRFDLVLAMDTENLENLRAICPDEFNGELRLFRDFDPEAAPGSSVPDPYYGGPQGFEYVLNLLEDGCEGLLENITKSET